MSLTYSRSTSFVNKTQGRRRSCLAGKGGRPLVYTTISQPLSFNDRSKAVIENIKCFKLFRTALKVEKNFKGQASASAGGGHRGEIDSFSYNSRKRLRFSVLNSFPFLISQFCCTYHHLPPSNGTDLKKHLNLFLTRIRKTVKCHYIWILEFQKSGNPHFHLFFTVPRNDGLHEYLARSWNRITKETPTHYLFHRHPKNFIDWDMGNGAYVTKYLDKSSQKNVPDGFGKVGRFWGCSRGLVPDPEIIFPETIEAQFENQIDLQTEKIVYAKDHIKFIFRCLRKHHEAKVRYWSKKKTGKKQRFKSPITRVTGCVLAFGGLIFTQALEYLITQNPKVPF
jgi:hypothetical protein